MFRRASTFLTTRRLLIWTTLFVLFVVFDITLFGYLIFDSLSQRELEEELLATRRHGLPAANILAKQAANYDGDLPLALSFNLTIGYVDDLVESREVVRRVEVRDANGAVIYDTGPDLDPGQSAARPRVDTEARPRVDGLKTSFDGLQEVEIPIGEFGTLVIGVSSDELQKRLAVLRADLLRQASAIGVLTLLLLAGAIAAVLLLVRRGRALEDQAHEAERMAYVGTLASGLAHEIRNPLNALSLNMQMLDEEADEGRLGGSAGRLLTITQSEIRRLERLVTDFMSYAKPRQLELEAVPAVDLLENVRTLLASETRARGAEVTIEDRTHGSQVRVDREQMRQLLLNLAQNALQATERSGHQPIIHLRVRNAGPKLALEIEDNGCGMDAKAQAKMFDIFFSTRRGGTGLGLAIVQRIAKNHGGQLSVESKPGEGTAIRLLLPRIGGRDQTTQTLVLPIPDGTS